MALSHAKRSRRRCSRWCRSSTSPGTGGARCGCSAPPWQLPPASSFRGYFKEYRAQGAVMRPGAKGPAEAAVGGADGNAHGC
jgi:hypothetical protein